MVRKTCFWKVMTSKIFVLMIVLTLKVMVQTNSIITITTISPRMLLMMAVLRIWKKLPDPEQERSYTNAENASKSLSSQPSGNKLVKWNDIELQTNNVHMLSYLSECL